MTSPFCGHQKVKRVTIWRNLADAALVIKPKPGELNMALPLLVATVNDEDG